MNTFYRNGQRVLYTNSGSAISAGDLVVIRSGTSGVCGVAVTDIAATTGTGELEICGVHALTAATGAITAGALVYRNSSGAITTTSTSNTLAGWAYAAKTTAATTAYVVLNGLPRP